MRTCKRCGFRAVGRLSPKDCGYCKPCAALPELQAAITEGRRKLYRSENERRKRAKDRAASLVKPSVPAAVISQRKLLARHIARNGPLSLDDELPDALLSLASSLPLILDCDWFERDADGWHLTGMGFVIARCA